MLALHVVCMGSPWMDCFLLPIFGLGIPSPWVLYSSSTRIRGLISQRCIFVTVHSVFLPAPWFSKIQFHWDTVLWNSHFSCRKFLIPALPHTGTKELPFTTPWEFKTKRIVGTNKHFQEYLSIHSYNYYCSYFLHLEFTLLSCFCKLRYRLSCFIKKYLRKEVFMFLGLLFSHDPVSLFSSKILKNGGFKKCRSPLEEKKKKREMPLMQRRIDCFS